MANAGAVGGVSGVSFVLVMIDIASLLGLARLGCELGMRLGAMVQRDPKSRLPKEVGIAVGLYALVGTCLAPPIYIATLVACSHASSVFPLLMQPLATKSGCERVVLSTKSGPQALTFKCALASLRVVGFAAIAGALPPFLCEDLRPWTRSIAANEGGTKPSSAEHTDADCISRGSVQLSALVTLRTGCRGMLLPLQ